MKANFFRQPLNLRSGAREQAIFQHSIFHKILVGLCFLFLSFKGSNSISELKKPVGTSDSVRVILLMSVDWEGAYISDENIQTIISFRDQFPEIKITHFINPAYFTQAGADQELLLRKIKSVIRPGIDQIGLHVHAWKSLIEAAHVTYRDEPIYLGDNRRTFPNVPDQGHDVMLYAYTHDELLKIFSTSLNILGQLGFSNISTFRAGGWIADANVLEALLDVGLTSDSSAVPYELLRSGLAGQPLLNEIARIWPKITSDHEILNLQLPSGRTITEYTNNLGLADYVTGTQAMKIIRHRIEETEAGTSIYAHYGFHEETAEYYSKHFFDFAKQLQALKSVGTKKVEIDFETTR